MDRVHPTGYDAEIGPLDLTQEDRLAKLLANADLSVEAVGLPLGKPKPPPDLLWTVRVVGTIALTRKKPAVVQVLDQGTKPELDHFRDVAAAADVLMADLRLASPAALVWNVSLNRSAEATVERSRCAVKADPAAKVFGLSCETLAWAVVDSGIDATHPAFRRRDNAKNAYETACKPGANPANRTRVKVGVFSPPA